MRSPVGVQGGGGPGESVRGRRQLRGRGQGWRIFILKFRGFFVNLSCILIMLLITYFSRFPHKKL